MGRRLRQDFLQCSLLQILKKKPTFSATIKEKSSWIIIHHDLQSYVFWLQAARHAVLEDIAASVGTASANISAKTSRQVKKTLNILNGIVSNTVND